MSVKFSLFIFLIIICLKALTRIAFAIVGALVLSKDVREGVTTDDTYRVHMLAPQIAQHGKKTLAYHPSNLTPDKVFLSDWTIRSMPFHHQASQSDRAYSDPVKPKDMGWLADPSKFSVDYDCRPSPTGVYEDCGPYAWNLFEYKNDDLPSFCEVKT
jgi:hypothetical protein